MHDYIVILILISCQDSTESPEEGRLPDAKQGLSLTISNSLGLNKRSWVQMVSLCLLRHVIVLSRIYCLHKCQALMISTLFYICIPGVSHLKDVFYRMGLSDKDIVALSGGHTLVNLFFFIDSMTQRISRGNKFFWLCFSHWREEHIQKDQALMALGQEIL